MTIDCVFHIILMFLLIKYNKILYFWSYILRRFNLYACIELEFRNNTNSLQ